MVSDVTPPAPCILANPESLRGPALVTIAYFFVYYAFMVLQLTSRSAACSAGSRNASSAFRRPPCETEAEYALCCEPEAVDVLLAMDNQAGEYVARDPPLCFEDAARLGGTSFDVARFRSKGREGAGMEGL